MKTAYYTFTVWEDNAMAAGFDGGAASRQAMLVRQPDGRARRTGGDNVIDLNAWRAEDEDGLWAETQDGPDWDEDEPEAAAPRPRRDHRRAMLVAELVSTVCVAAVAAALILRVLTF